MSFRRASPERQLPQQMGPQRPLRKGRHHPRRGLLLQKGPRPLLLKERPLPLRRGHLQHLLQRAPLQRPPRKGHQRQHLKEHLQPRLRRAPPPRPQPRHHLQKEPLQQRQLLRPHLQKLRRRNLRPPRSRRPCRRLNQSQHPPKEMHHASDGIEDINHSDFIEKSIFYKIGSFVSIIDICKYILYH